MPETEEPETELAETEIAVLEDSEVKKVDLDFFPTKDTITIISNLDADGILCIAAVIKMINSPQKDKNELGNRVRIFFTSQPNIFSTLAKSIPELNRIDDDDFTIGQLYICDLSLHRDTLLGSSIYDSVKWFDHHEVNPAEQYDSELDNIELIIDPTAKSTTSIISDHFKIGNDINKIADEIDTNNITSKKARRFQEIISGLQLIHFGSNLKKALYELANELANDFKIINQKSYDQIIEEYNKWIEEFNKDIDEKFEYHEINGHKIGILEAENTAPLYSIYNNLKSHSQGPFDVLAVLIHKYYRLGRDKNNKFKSKKYSKVEFRTYTDEEIIELAKLFEGGGHKYASGATIHDGLEKDDLVKTIQTYYSTSSEKKEQVK